MVRARSDDFLIVADQREDAMTRLLFAAILALAIVAELGDLE
jgi:hypothetical protein